MPGSAGNSGEQRFDVGMSSVFLEHPVKRRDNVGFAKAAHGTLFVRVAAAERRRRGTFGIDEKLSIVRVPSNQPPWLDTGIDFASGDQVSTFAVGTTSLPDTPISFHTALQLWSRIGPDGQIFRGTRPTNSFETVKEGRLYVGTSFPGEFATRTGGLAVPPET